jgi:hypothetical protein
LGRPGRGKPRPYNQFCQAKVQDLRLATLGHENVRWFDVAMNDALRMGGVKRVGNLDGKVEEGVNA